MKAHVLTGSKSEIAEQVGRIDGAIREVIVLVDELPPAAPVMSEEEFFAEMAPFMVNVGNADDSREAIYTRQEGE